MQLSHGFLKEANDFALMYNCTDLGKRNRCAAALKELDTLRLEKHQLEYGIYLSSDILFQKNREYFLSILF